MKFRSYEQHQIMLLPNSIEDMIPENHLVRAIDMVVDQLNLRQLYNSYGEEGQPAYHTKMLIKILLYGYATGIRSSRKLSEKLECDVFYIYLAGMQKPDFRTISDFRKNKKEYLCDCFKEVLQMCSQIGLVSLGHVAIDGTKIAHHLFCLYHIFHLPVHQFLLLFLTLFARPSLKFPALSNWYGITTSPLLSINP